MQKNSMAEKKQILIDGEEWPGLVNVGEISIEAGTIEIPEFHRIRIIKNGIKKIPVVNVIYQITRNSITLKGFRDWFFKDEDHEVIIKRTDAHGIEFARSIMPGCECIKYAEPAFDGANVTYAQLPTILVPWDFIPLDAG